MATTKKQEDLDYTAQKQAESAADVDQQDSRTRLWQSLKYGYDKQQRDSDKAYDKLISQSNNQALSRGMGRSSYALQTAANLGKEKVNAQNDINAALIAAYQGKIGDIEQQEKDDERWERQFAESQRQFNEQMGFQQKESERTQSNWEKEYAAGREDTAWNRQFQQSQMDYQKQRDVIADQQWQKQYDEQLRQFNENMAYQKERANVSDAQWQKTYEENLRQFNKQMEQQEEQFKANLAFQQNENALNRAYQTSERVAQQEFQAGESAKQREYSTQERLAQQLYNTQERLAQQAYSTSEREAQQEFTAGQSELQRAQNASQFAEQMALQREQNAQTQANWEIQQAFQEKQWQAQQDQWRTEFDYNKMTDDQKIAFTVITAAAGNGTDVSDDVLKRAGISRADYNAMKKQAAATGGANNPGSSKPWEKAGMTEAEWNAMKAAGFTDPTKYRDYILEQAGKNGNKVGSHVAKVSSNTTPKVTKPTNLSKEYK